MFNYTLHMKEDNIQVLLKFICFSRMFILIFNFMLS